jgi:hypothetical protein
MSRISYCSLEEAWGGSLIKPVNNNDNDNNENDNRNNNRNNDNINQNQINSNRINNNQNNQQNNQTINNSINKYNNLMKKSDSDRDEIIQNMNKVERNNHSFPNENNSIVEYNKYRLNPENVVSNHSDKIYSPFQESIEKKYLQDKIHYLESEFRKYKYFLEKTDSNKSDDYTIENFDNNHSTNNSGKNDLIDLILLIIIGLIIIFIMNSIFTIGKQIGMKQK